VPTVERGIGVNSNLVTRDIVYENLSVTGYYRGIRLPRQGFGTVIGGTYDNHDDFLIETAIRADRMVFLTGPIQMDRLVMDTYFNYPAPNTEFMFLDDRVILNFGSFQNSRVYYAVQEPSAIPFPAAFEGIPAAYIGLTSQQLWNQFGIAVGGTLAPADAVSVPEIVGLVGPPG